MNRVAVISSHVQGEEPYAVGADGVAVVIMHNPPMNALNHATRVHLVESIRKANESESVKAIVIVGSGKAFSAGADINEFTPTAMKEPFLPEVLDGIEASKKVVVAAINGVALGGGYELALACHIRVASSAATVGLPEIKLGLIPGAGGTQRLPRLVGIKEAIGVACSGRFVKAAPAKAIGLVDIALPTADRAALVSAAKAAALDAVAKKLPVRRLSRDTSRLGNCLTNAFILRMANNQLLKSVPHGVTSPFRCLEAIGAAASVATFQDGMAVERKIFMECTKTPQARAMVHFFFAQRDALRIPNVPKDAAAMPVRRVGVIGGGTMGGGIAICCLNAGIPTVILETSLERKAFAERNIQSVYAAAQQKKKLTEAQVAERLAMLTVVVNDFSALSSVDYVIEAVFENMQLKKDVFQKLDAVCKPSCVLASNTSTLSIDDIASATRRPQSVIGAHFFSPANVMPLLEFVRGAQTSTGVILTSLELGKRIRKTPVVVGNCFGFVSNRMILRAGFQAMSMVEDGCFPREVDAVIKRFGFPVGPFAMQDIAGLDVGSKIRSETPAAFLPKRDVTTLSEMLVKQGRHGQKTLRGWYRYDAKAPRTALHDAEVDKMVVQVSALKKITRRTISNVEIEERYLLALVNEAAAILDEGIALRPSDIDVIFIFGFGFPAYKGGPCHYADFLGIRKVVDTMQKFHAALGPDTFPPPCPLLLAMAKDNVTFSSRNERP